MNKKILSLVSTLLFTVLLIGPVIAVGSTNPTAIEKNKNLEIVEGRIGARNYRGEAAGAAHRPGHTSECADPPRSLACRLAHRPSWSSHIVATISMLPLRRGPVALRRQGPAARRAAFRARPRSGNRENTTAPVGDAIPLRGGTRQWHAPGSRSR